MQVCMEENKMVNTERLSERMMKIGRMVGEKCIITVGIDSIKDRIDILTVEAVSPHNQKIQESPEVIPRYLG